MLIIAGTSLKAYPAKTFINEFCGEHIVVINQEKVDLYLNKGNDLFICDSIGSVFSKINEYFDFNIK